MHISAVWLTSCSSMCVGREGRGCCVCRPAHPRSQTCTWWPVAGRCLGGLCWRWSQRDRPQTSATCPEGGKNQKWITLSLSIANILVNMEMRRLQDQHLLYTGHKPTTEERNKLWSFLQFLTCVSLSSACSLSLIFLCLFDSFYKAWPVNLP